VDLELLVIHASAEGAANSYLADASLVADPHLLNHAAYLASWSRVIAPR